MMNNLSPKLNKAITNVLRRIEEETATYNTEGVEFTNSTVCGKYFQLRLANETREHFEVAYLDSQHKLIKCVRLFSGTIDAATVYPRIVVKTALELNASAMIISHNHPSGSNTFSNADLALTDRIKEGASLLDLRVLDHILVCRGDGGESVSVSLASQGGI